MKRQNIRNQIIATRLNAVTADMFQALCRGNEDLAKWNQEHADGIYFALRTITGQTRLYWNLADAKGAPTL